MGPQKVHNNTVEDVRLVYYLIRLYTIEWDSDQYGVIRKVVVVICATVLPSTALSLVGVYYSERKKRRGEKGLPTVKRNLGGEIVTAPEKDVESVRVRVCVTQKEREREREGQNKDKKTVLLLLYSFILILESNCWTDSTYLDSSRIKSLQFSILCCMQHRHIEKHECQQQHN